MHELTNRAVAGLARYLDSVTERLGDEMLTIDQVTDTELTLAIVTVAPRLPTITEKPLLLTWDEVNGWALRLQLDDDGDTTAVTYLGGDILPGPDAVHDFLRNAVRGHHPGTIAPPGLRRPGTVDIPRTAPRRACLNRLANRRPPSRRSPRSSA